MVDVALDEFFHSTLSKFTTEYHAYAENEIIPASVCRKQGFHQDEMKAKPFCRIRREKLGSQTRSTASGLSHSKSLQSKANSRSGSSLCPHRHTGGPPRYAACIFKTHKDPVRCRIKRDVTIALGKDSERRRRIGSDLRSHSGTNR